MIRPFPRDLMADVFDETESQKRKDEGMKIAAEAQPTLLDKCREVAVEIAMDRPDRKVSSDDVGIVMLQRHNVSGLGPVGGSIFRGPNWVFTGERVRSTRTTNHAREIKVWRYTGGNNDE